MCLFDALLRDGARDLPRSGWAERDLASEAADEAATLFGRIPFLALRALSRDAFPAGACRHAPSRKGAPPAVGGAEKLSFSERIGRRTSALGPLRQSGLPGGGELEVLRHRRHLNEQLPRGGAQGLERELAVLDIARAHQL